MLGLTRLYEGCIVSVDSDLHLGDGRWDMPTREAGLGVMGTHRVRAESNGCGDSDSYGTGLNRRDLGRYCLPFPA